ncbi:hypothetical protein ASC97_18580 [Rhizobium sp. Root1203]|nr:hypothetical protein ASC97_18580 [Rhizobium sp. Root1203]
MHAFLYHCYRAPVGAMAMKMMQDSSTARTKISDRTMPVGSQSATSRAASCLALRVFPDFYL